MKEEKPFSLEENLAEIRRIMNQMQKGMDNFDEQVALFKKGKALIEDCQQYLDKAEMEIKKLVDGQLEDFDSNF
jgi:exodeoxyribonuclease VII small subunit